MKTNETVETSLVNFNNVEDQVLSIRGTQVIIDSDVAALYGVQTKEINQAVKNNPDKFPLGYVFELENKEVTSLRSKFLTLNNQGQGQHSKYPPKAFTEKGLYMLATILKSPKATQTTIAIVETFAKIRELSRTFSELSEVTEEAKQKPLMQKGSEIIADLLDNGLKKTGTETCVELNFAVVKVKHTITRTTT